MKYQLPLVFVAVLFLAPLPVAAQTPAALKVVAIGQLHGPLLRQMMNGVSCGPFFTIAPTDANGGGLVNLAVETQLDVEVVTLSVKAIHVKFCDSCEAPLFRLSGNETSVRGDLMISHAHWQISPCLKAAKVSKD
jgi:hypothetical protein